MKIYNILITGGALSNNEGSAAMTLVTANLIRKYIPNSSIKIITPYFKDCSERNKIFGYEIIQKCHIILAPTSREFLKQFVYINKIYRMLKEYKKADLIIDVSGDMISDVYGTVETLGTIKELLVPILFKKPIIFFPQSMGPFNNMLTRLLAKNVFNKSKVIIAREKITYKYLRKLGIKTTLLLVDDTAFLLKPINKQKLNLIKKKENIKIKKLLIGISLSQSIARYSKAKTDEKRKDYITTMTNIVNYLTKKATLVFIPHVTGRGEPSDDRLMCKLIYSKARDKNMIILLHNKYLPSELKGIISLCDLFIGSRMHANIAALSTNVPTVAIAYSNKTYGIMRMCKQEEYICDIMNLDEKDIIKKIEKALKNKDKIEKQLKIKNEEIEKNEEILSKIIKKVLNYK